MEYKVGDKIEIKYVNGFQGIVEIVETEIGRSNTLILIKLPDKYKGKGHNGRGLSKKVYTTNDYWFIYEKDIIRTINKNMKLEDLKVGKHVIEMRAGNKFLILESNNCIFGIDLNSNSIITCLDTYSHNNDMLARIRESEYDIVKIYEIDKPNFFNSLKDDLKLVWERKEPVKDDND